MADIDRHTNSVGHPWYPVSAVSEFAKIIDWFDGVDTVEFSCHPDCGFANWLIKNEKTGAVESLKHYVDVDKALEIPFCTYNTLHRERIENELSVIRPGTRSAAPAISTP
jgi:uncharacterized radical SAM superfamily Fe-S cluster-containing enzyme